MSASGSSGLLVSVLCLLCFRACLFIDALWSPAGKGLISWLSFVMINCEFVTFPIGILGQVWYLIVLIPDLCPLSYYAFMNPVSIWLNFTPHLGERCKSFGLYQNFYTIDYVF